LEEVLRRQGLAEGRLRWGGGGAETHLICGSFRLEEVSRGALVPLLPSVIHVPGQAGRALEWLDLSLRALEAELHQPSPGTELAVSRLVDLIFVHVVRYWLERQPAGAAGWLGATRDPQIGAALARMHAEPERAWTAEALARGVGMSRSAFGSRFAALVGEPPLRHLSRWRVQLAAMLLRGGALRTHEIAARVGYRTEAAFSRTFKRFAGQAPQVFRRRPVGPEGEGRESAAARPAKQRHDRRHVGGERAAGEGEASEGPLGGRAIP
jgi:AraC-like DNA-binding protein